MTAGAWRVTIATTKARRFWETLSPAVRERIEQELGTNPFHNELDPGAIKHLKGKVEGKNRRCHREYRRLPNNCRLFYAIDQEARVVHILYGGPHP